MNIATVAQFIRAVAAIFVALIMIGLAACGSSNPPAQPAPRVTEPSPAQSPPCVAEECILNTAPGLGAGTSDGPTRVVTDAAGRQVTIPSRPTALATNAPTVIAELLLLRECDKIATTRTSYKAYEYMFRLCPSLMSLPAPTDNDASWNVEGLAAASVDLVLAYKRHIPQLDTVAKVGIPSVVLSDALTFRDTSDNLTYIANLLGGTAPARAKEYSQYLDSNVSRVRSALSGLDAGSRPKVLMVQNPEGVVVSPKLSIEQEWIGIAGGMNPAESLPGIYSATVSLEQIIRWNPDIIVTNSGAGRDTILSDPRWAPIAAVRDKKVFPTPSGVFLWSRYGNEAAINVLWAAKTIHPERFESVDMEAETSDFYRRFYGFTPTPEEVTTILNPSK